jgi:hypothetical protein
LLLKAAIRLVGKELLFPITAIFPLRRNVFRLRAITRDYGDSLPPLPHFLRVSKVLGFLSRRDAFKGCQPRDFRGVFCHCFSYCLR